MRALVAVVLMLLLAGCSDRGNEPASIVIVDSSEQAVIDGNGTKPSEAKPKAGERGHLSGIVVDETITPVAGAVVRLPGLEAETRTDDAGAFAFADLWPGPYYLEADAAGHEMVSAVVDVTRDAFTKVRIELARAPSEDPYHVTHEFNGFAELAMDPITGASVLTCNQCSFRAFMDRDPDTVIVEAVRENRYDDPTLNQGWYGVVEDGSGDRIASDRAEGPLLLRLEADQVAGEVALLTKAYPTAYPLPEQSVAFEVYVTFFHNGAAPEDWSFVGGSV